MELSAIATLVLMAAYFLAVSWRKWPDPLIDGYQWYTAWQLSEGAVLYRDLSLAYGPLSSYFNAFLFKCFGPGMMVMVTANLVIYGFILGLIYFTFRTAWGWLAAFAASAVFISVFSFSQLLRCGNFNFAAPYSHEIIHGTLVILIAVVVAARWCREPSGKLAFLLGLCGGLASVLKPEFMLAGGLLGIAALSLRRWRRQPIHFNEIIFIIAGLAVPTLAFAAWFARTEPWPTAFMNASHAWWLVFAEKAHRAGFQQHAIGMNHPLKNILFQLGATASAVVMVGSVWAVGRAFNHPWSIGKRLATICLAVALSYAARLTGGWLEVGLCLPGLIGILFIIRIRHLRREHCDSGQFSFGTVMGFMLIVLAGAMLARMSLRARIYDFGFYQAAFAGMVVSAAMVSDLPRWTGFNSLGRRIVLSGSVALLACACISIAIVSHRIHSTQTQPVGSGADRFYAFNPMVDTTGELVKWTINQLATIPPHATLLVMPEGPLINYISRHKYPLKYWISISGGATEEESREIIEQLNESPPDYIVLISRPMSEHGVHKFGADGTPAATTLKWIHDNYRIVASKGGDPLRSYPKKGAMILQRNIVENSLQ